MNTLDLDLELQLREDAPGDGVAVLYGRAVPYGTPTNVGGVTESFAPGAFDPKDVMGKPLAWRHGEPIGVITGAANQDDGLYITATILDTAQGRDAAVLVRAGAVKGLSVGFTPVKSAWNRARTVVTHTLAGLAETSLTHMPAYATAGVSAIREGEPMNETTESETVVVSAPDTEAREALVEVRSRVDALEASVHVSEPAHPLAKFRSLADYAQAVYAGDVETRAIADQITSENPGVLPPSWAMSVKNIVGFGRPGITALGVESAGSSGLDFNWPYFDGDLTTLVGEQATQKTDIVSLDVSFKKGAATLKTYAGGSDIAYQLIQRSSPSYLEAYLRVMAAAYATVTDNAFVDALVTGGTASAIDYDLAADTDGSKFRAAVFGASVEVETATGSPASVVLVASDVFAKMGGWSTLVPAPYGTQNVSGVATASTLAVSVSGLSVVHDRNLAAGSIVVTNGSAASWIEDGPMIASAETPTKLGRDVAVYGYGCAAIYNAKGVVKLTNLP